MLTRAGHGRIGVGVVRFFVWRWIRQRTGREPEGEEGKKRDAESTTAKNAI
jgi:hypothetical protein